VSDTRDDRTSSPANDWKEGEKELRQQEIDNQQAGTRAQRWGTRAQVVTAVAATVAAAVAVWISFNAREAVDVARDSVERQAEENRIATAVDAIKGDGPVAQRIAALTRLRRQAVQ
jgi:hypothetical protein